MNKPIEHTEEFYDVAQKLPGRYSSWMTYGLFMIILLAVLLGFLIDVPERVYAEVKVMSTNPPITLNAQTSGKLHIIINTSFIKCDKGQYLAVIENSANYKDVMMLKAWLEVNDIFREDSDIDELQYNAYILGDIESDFFAFKISFIKYHQLLEGHNDYSHSLSLIDSQIDASNESLESYKSLLSSYLDEMKIRSYYKQSDSLLYEQKIIPKDEFDNSNIKYMEIKNKISSIENEISQIQNTIIQNEIKRDQIVDGINNALDEAKFSLGNAYYRLLIQIRNWEKNFVIIAPDDCNAEFANLITQGSFVTAGEPVYNIIYDNNSYFAIAVLPSDGAGNVTKGDSVNINMMLYPYQEYGYLRGVVERISMNTIEKGYLLYINLPDGVRSDNGNTLSFAEAMYGQAEIITSKKRLIKLLFNRLKTATRSRNNLENSTDTDERNSTRDNSIREQIKL